MIAMDEPTRLTHRVRGLLDRGEAITTDDARALLEMRDLTPFGPLSAPVRERAHGRDAFFGVAEPLIWDGQTPDELAEQLGMLPDDTVEIALLVQSAGHIGSPSDWPEKLAALASADRRIVIRVDAEVLLDGTSATLDELEVLIRDISAAVPFEIAPDRFAQDDPFFDRESIGATSPESWLLVAKAAHNVGLRTDAAIRYHSNSDLDAIVGHLEVVRSMIATDEEGGFRRIVLLPYSDRATSIGHEAPPTATTTLRLAATVRMFLESIEHVVLPWRQLDGDLAAIGLSYGVDCIDPVPSTTLTGLAVASDGELPVVSAQNEWLDLDRLESRIHEARYQPVPVDRFGTRFTLIDEPNG